MRDINRELQIKILKIAAVICSANGSIAGNRVCQDWSINELNPEDFLNKKEKEDLIFNYEQANSDGREYDPDYLPIGDEMVLSFAIKENIKLIIKGLENEN